MYLIGTHSFLILVECDDNWQIKSYQVINDDHHYGMAITNNQQILSLRRIKDDFEVSKLQLVTYEKKSDSLNLLKIDPFFEKTGEVHQLAYKNNGIYITNTRYNSLVFQDLDNYKRQEYHFEGVTYDLNHINSVYPCGNYVFVLLHNLGKKESELVVLEHNISQDFILKKTISLWHKNCHNIFVDNNYLYYNASDEGKFVVVDLKKERIVKVLNFPGHTKGMSVTKDYFLIGYSDHVVRSQRYTTKGFLAAIDRQSLTTKSIIDLNLSHPIGNINEIRCISEQELAHTTDNSLDIDWEKMQLSRGDYIYQLRCAKRRYTHKLRMAKKKYLKLLGVK